MTAALRPVSAPCERWGDSRPFGIVPAELRDGRVNLEYLQ